MITAIAAGWAGLVSWFSRNPIVIWLAGILLILLGWEKIKKDIRDAAKKSERAAAEVKAIEIVRTIEKEARYDADNAIAARDAAPDPDTADRVSDEVSARIFRD